MLTVAFENIYFTFVTLNKSKNTQISLIFKTVEKNCKIALFY